MANPNELFQRNGLDLKTDMRSQFSRTPDGQWLCELCPTYDRARPTAYSGTAPTQRGAEHAACAALIADYENPAPSPPPQPASSENLRRAATLAQPPPRGDRQAGLTMTSYTGRKKVTRMSVKGYDLEELHEWLHNLGPEGRARFSADDPRTGRGGCNFAVCYNVPDAPLPT